MAKTPFRTRPPKTNAWTSSTISVLEKAKVRSLLDPTLSPATPSLCVSSLDFTSEHLLLSQVPSLGQERIATKIHAVDGTLP